MKFRRALCAAAAALAALALSGCASISPARQDVAIVEGRLSPRGGDWACGTAPRDSGGYFYVCDMPLSVRRVILGSYPGNTVTARFFFLEVDRQDEVVVGPSVRANSRVAAILWRRPDGPHSYMLMDFQGRWCLPDWMFASLNIGAGERQGLLRAGYPACPVSP